MPQVIIERPRWGHSMRNHSVRSERMSDRAADAERLDALPRHGPMAPRKGHRKSLEENLAPLLRYLRSQVGRPWDKVYAEIRANLAPKSAVQMHILQHLFQYVERHVVFEGRRVYRAEHAWNRVPLNDDGQTFYVHPASGLLCVPRQRLNREAMRALWAAEHGA